MNSENKEYNIQYSRQIKLAEIGLESERLSKSQLQLEEVDWAKFVSANDAYPITSRSQLIIIDRHLNK